MKKVRHYPVQHHDVFVIPRLLQSLGLYPKNSSEESFKEELKKAKQEWIKWDKNEWIVSMEQVCWALFRLFKSLTVMSQDLEIYRHTIKEVEEQLEELKDIHPALYNLYITLLENKNAKEV